MGTIIAEQMRIAVVASEEGELLTEDLNCFGAARFDVGHFGDRQPETSQIASGKCARSCLRKVDVFLSLLGRHRVRPQQHESPSANILYALLVGEQKFVSEKQIPSQIGGY